LVREVRQRRTDEDVKSYEAEGSLVVAAVLGDELTGHEPVVDLEGEGRRARRFGPGPRSFTVQHADEAVEVGDGGDLRAASREEEVEAPEVVDLGASGDRLRHTRALRGPGERRHQQLRSRHEA